IGLAAWKIDDADTLSVDERFLAVDINRREGIDIVCRNSDAPACPVLRNGDFALIPGNRGGTNIIAAPRRVGMQGLGRIDITARNLKEAPLVGRYSQRFAGLGILRRLPAPQVIDADALTSGRLLVKCLFQVPDNLDAFRK